MVSFFISFFLDKICSHLSPEVEFESKANLFEERTKSEDVISFTDQKSTDSTRRGSAGIVGTMMLLNSYQSMHAPFTQVFFQTSIPIRIYAHAGAHTR